MLAQPHTGPEGTAPHPVDPGTYPGAPPAYPVGQYTSTGQNVPTLVPVYEKSNGMLAAGIIQLIVGVALFILNCVIFSTFGTSGIFSSVFVIITGALCIAAGHVPNRGLITGSLVMSILASLGIWAVIIVALLLILSPSLPVVEITAWLMMVLGIVGSIAALVASINACYMNRQSSQPDQQMLIMAQEGGYPQSAPQGYPDSVPQSYPQSVSPGYLNSTPPGYPPSYSQDHNMMPPISMMDPSPSYMSN